MTSLRTAALFPGQGTSVTALRHEITSLRPDLVAVLDDATGADAFARSADSTRFAQPAIVCSSLARWSALAQPRIDVVLGHSLGELSAYAAAGALGEADAIRLAARRGQLMDDAAGGEPGGMCAVLKGELEDVEALAAAHGLTLANDNAPGQVVVSGPLARLGGFERAALGAGLRAIRLSVSGAFHSPLMAPARAGFAAALAAVTFSEPSIVLWSSILAAPVRDPTVALLAGIEQRVRFRESLLALDARGARELIDVGPGEVLSGLVRRTLGTGALAHA